MTRAPKKAPKGTREPARDKRLENLRPAWQPGESGNPAGLPPGTVQLRTVLRAKLAEAMSGEDSRTLAETLVDSTIHAAIAGDSQARRLIWEYLEGRPSQALTLTAIPPSEDAKRLANLAGMSDEELCAEAREIIIRRGPRRTLEQLNAEIAKVDAEYHRMMDAKPAS